MYKINHSNWKKTIDVCMWDRNLSDRLSKLKTRANVIESIRQTFSELFITVEGVDSIECLFVTGKTSKPSVNIRKYQVKRVNCSSDFVYEEEKANTKTEETYLLMNDDQLKEYAKDYINQEVDLIVEYTKLNTNLSYKNWLSLKQTNINKLVDIVKNSKQFKKQNDILHFYSELLMEIEYQINCENSRLVMNEKYNQLINHGPR